MATSKLTLSVDQDTIQLAKEFASEENISISKLFKTLITDIAKKKNKKDLILEKYKNVKLPPDVIALTGILKGKYAEETDNKDMKYEYLKEKYGL